MLIGTKIQIIKNEMMFNFQRKLEVTDLVNMTSKASIAKKGRIANEASLGMFC